MNRNEKKMFLIGSASGLLFAAVALGAVAVQHNHSSMQTGASTPTTSTVAQTTQEASTTPAPGATLQLSPDEITAAGVQTATVKTTRLKTDVQAFGRVEQPEAQLSAIPARVAGRIDKLHLQYTGEKVRRGQPIAEIYSPDVATAMDEYHLAVANRDRLRGSTDPELSTQSDALVSASQRKLELWGVTEQQIHAAPKAAVPHVTIYSNTSGTVVERKVTNGQYVNAGDTLFTVADLSEVWIKADVYESQLPQIRSGQSVTIESEALPNQKLHGRVDFIEPVASPQTRTVPVHVHVGNPGMRLVPGMFVSATFVEPAERETAVIPRSAVIDTGTRKIVYVARENGAFESREVEVGSPTEDLFPVVKGLTAGEKVVINGNFLIDSQTRLSSGMSSLYGGSKEYGNSKAATPQSSQTSPSAKIDLRIEPNPPKGAEENTFHVMLTDARGNAVEGATVKVTLVMPAMPSMGMPEMRNSFVLPWMHGMYMGKGMVGMAGPWEVSVEASKDGKTIATYRTHVTAK